MTAAASAGAGQPLYVDIASLAQTLARSVLDSLADPAWVKDTRHRYVAVNAAFRAMCEFQAGSADVEVIDTTDFNLFPLEMAEQSLQEDLEVIAAHGAKRGTLVIFNPAGEARQYETHRVALLDGAGGVAGTLGLAFDVTETAARLAHIRENERTLSTLVGRLQRRLPRTDRL
jgi:PAS domain-containing protein